MCFNAIDDIGRFVILLGNVDTKLYVGSFLFKVNGLTYVVQKSCSSCQCAVKSELVDFHLGQCGPGVGKRDPAAVGIHPENLENLPADYLAQIAELTKHPKVVAIGETGLDYHWDIPKPDQLRVFEEQLQLSLDLNMPIVVHDREAHGDTFDLLRRYKPNALVHCFSGSVELMREAMRLGCYISLGGVVTFKNARHSVEVASEIPLDRLLLETDAPYMAPVPFRGKRCDSSMILYAAEKIASLRGITAQELLDITAQNARQFYRI